MPQLPSGRHVAIDPTPFLELAKDIDNPFNAHKIMAIQSWPDLWPWLELQILVPEADASEEDRRRAAEQKPLGPPGLIATYPGTRLDKWRAFTTGWSEADIQAIQDLLDHRAKKHFQKHLDHAKQLQAVLLENPDTLAEVLAHLWKAECHPLQTEEPIDPALLQWDTYDLLAALGRVKLMNDPDLRARHSLTFTRLEGLWAFMGQLCPALTEKRGTGEPRALAAQWRKEGWLTALPEDKQGWLRQQAVIECLNLWEHLEDDLAEAGPEATNLIELAALSPEAGQPRA
jgi:hypothetical protein